MLDILQFALGGGFWHFVGCFLILYLAVDGAVRVSALVIGMLGGMLGGRR